MNQMTQTNQTQTYDDTVQNFQISDEVLIIPLSYETEYGACFASGTKGTVKMISEPDMAPCKTWAYWVHSDEYGYGQFYLASELKKVEE